MSLPKSRCLIVNSKISYVERSEEIHSLVRWTECTVHLGQIGNILQDAFYQFI